MYCSFHKPDFLPCLPCHSVGCPVLALLDNTDSHISGSERISGLYSKMASLITENEPSVAMIVIRLWTIPFSKAVNRNNFSVVC